MRIHTTSAVSPAGFRKLRNVQWYRSMSGRLKLQAGLPWIKQSVWKIKEKSTVTEISGTFCELNISEYISNLQQSFRIKHPLLYSFCFNSLAITCQVSKIVIDLHVYENTAVKQELVLNNRESIFMLSQTGWMNQCSRPQMACDSYIFLSVNVGIHTSDSLWALAQVIHTSHFNRVIRWLAHNLPNTPFVFDLDFSTAFQYQR